jgi:serine/threonine-protein kinase RsbT
MLNMEDDAKIKIVSDLDVVVARQKGRSLALNLGFTGSDVTMIATAISEIARNIVIHAKHGTMTFFPLLDSPKPGLRIVAQDEGPGIRDVQLAMQYGYSSRQGLGVGLPGAKWLMDEFEIDTKAGKGTVITMLKWLRS